MADGLTAYAKRQSAIYQGLAQSFAHTWAPRLRTANITADWLSVYNVPSPPSVVASAGANASAPLNTAPSGNISGNISFEGLDSRPQVAVPAGMSNTSDASYEAYGFRSTAQCGMDQIEGDWSDDSDDSDAESEAEEGAKDGIPGDVDVGEEWDAPTGEWMD